MKRLLFVFHDSNPKSGATASMLEVVSYLNDIKHYHITVLLPKHKGGLRVCLDKMNIEYKEENIFGVRYIVGSNKTLISRLKSIVKVFLNFLLAMKLYLLEMKFDLVYTNTSDVYIGAYLARMLNAPHVWHIREFGIEDQRRSHLFGEKAFYHLVGKSNKVVAISNALTCKLTRFGILQSKIEVIHNDVARERKQWRRIYNFDDRLKLLIVGSLSKEKGHEFLVECIKYIKLKGIEVKLGIVGDISTDYAVSLMNKVRAYELESFVTFHGYSVNVDMIRKDYDISVVASKSEAFGRVTIEAMHAKMLVMASDSGANPELITHGKNGFLFKDSSVDSFYKVIWKIENNRALLERIGEEAYSYSERFSNNRAGKAVNRVIRDLLN